MGATGFVCPKCGQDERFDANAVVLVGKTYITSDGWNYVDYPNDAELYDSANMTCCKCGHSDNWHSFCEARVNPSSFGSVPARVFLQEWVDNYALETGSVVFDCSRALDNLSIETVSSLALSCEHAADELFLEAMRIGLVSKHDGPFDLYIEDREAFDRYYANRLLASSQMTVGGAIYAEEAQ